MKTDGSLVQIVGGPAHGSTIERPQTSAVNIPVIAENGVGFAAASYTMRRCRTEAGFVVEILAPAGRDVDPKWLRQNRLTN